VLAAGYVDRYLSVVPTLKSRLQLLGTACLFIASKLKETAPFTADKLISCTDYSITSSQLMVLLLLLLMMMMFVCLCPVAA